MKKSIVFNSITINLPKNIIQFSVGALLFVAMFGTFDVVGALFAAVAYLVLYSSVYVYNDMIDAGDDAKHPHKRQWKLVASGLLSEHAARKVLWIMLIAGAALSLFVNPYFMGLMLFAVLLNYLHSSPRTYFKGSIKKTAANMTLIEFLKYSSGWFAFTTNVSSFPFWIILTLSLAYTISYIVYKAEDTSVITKQHTKLLGASVVIAFIAYSISLFAYSMPLAMVLMLVLPSMMIFMFRNTKRRYNTLNSVMTTQLLLLFTVIFSLSIIFIPPAAEANENIAMELDNYAETIKNGLPYSVVEKMDVMAVDLQKYKDLNDIFDDFGKKIARLRLLKARIFPKPFLEERT
ncbi:MAG: UbiA family prenyltransferase [Candidatus Micrarchaeota archaeon]|nr:UbiA family prenyltransferase [Candidatus Micrarchaeota archaeon]